MKRKDFLRSISGLILAGWINIRLPELDSVDEIVHTVYDDTKVIERWRFTVTDELMTGETRKYAYEVFEEASGKLIWKGFTDELPFQEIHYQ